MVLAAGASAPGPTDCNGTPSRSGYYLTATPTTAANGRRGFATSNAQVIYFDLNGVPPTEAAMLPGGGGDADSVNEAPRAGLLPLGPSRFSPSRPSSRFTSLASTPPLV